MILTTVLFGAIIISGTIAAFWEDLVDFAKKTLKALKLAAEGFKVFIKKVGEFIQEIIRIYRKLSDNMWEETTKTRRIPESEVPEDIREKTKNNREEVDITTDLELQLD